MMMKRETCRCAPFARLMALVAGSCLSGAALAGPVVTITPIVVELDFYGWPITSGFGASENFAVNNSGVWLVESDTTNPNGDEDGLVIRGTGHTTPGTILFTEGQALTLPAGALLDSFDSITINAHGNSAFNFFLSNVPGLAFDSGVYFNDNLLILESTFSTAASFSPNTPYTGWFEVRINDQDQILMLASVDDPAIASTVDRALVIIDNPAGAFTETVIAKEGDELITGRFVTDFSTGPHSIAFRNNARTIFIADMDGDAATDGLVCQYDGSTITILAREGHPSPVAGRNWGTLISTAVDINNSGQWVMRGDLDGATTDDAMIVRNGTDILAREGDPIPVSIGTETFTGFGTGGVAIADNGDVIYVALWTGDAATNTGIFVNNTLLVQKGVSTVDGWTVTAISTVQDNITASPDGRWIIFEGTLADGRDGAFLIERLFPVCPADFDNSGTVEVADIFAFLAAWFAGDPAAFNFGGTPGVPAIFAFLAAWFAGCG
ncbi:MAG: hypothetical protein KF869_09365 [Phycisphaeraceae bacterium]|nr:hypothetical protein [Phycisphaeraceae bacterium]